MAKLKFDQPNERFFEAGVSKGVLYVLSDDSDSSDVEGVAWNGLTSVTESPEGAEPTAIYADDIKYLNLLSAEDFKATIEAYTYPDAFAECDGSAEILMNGAGDTKVASGVFLGQQPRKKFAFSYQTRIGNDASGTDLGYKIHIIYNCLAAPSERAHESINDSPEGMTMSWEISTTPVEVEGYKPTAHIVIDSRKVASAKLTAIEAALYGTDPTTGSSSSAGTTAKLLYPDDILDILNTQG